MKFFVDTHDSATATFPEGLDAEALAGFLASYEKACADHGVTVMRLHVGQDAARAFCFTMAPDAEAVRRAHEQAGLPFDTITEVKTVDLSDLFLAPRAA